MRKMRRLGGIWSGWYSDRLFACSHLSQFWDVNFGSGAGWSDMMTWSSLDGWEA